MLARGRGELFSPAALFRKASELDMELELEYRCRRAAIDSIARHKNNLPGISFFINVSPDVFTSQSFQTGFTAAALRDRGVEESKIVLEITETASVGDYRAFEEMIRHYVGQGFNIALDDFGAGNSGLVTLVAVTPHFLKLDRELVRGIHRNTYKQGLVKHIADFAESMGIQLIGEGIEVDEELQTLFRLGARYGQGFLFAPPSELPGNVSGEMFQRLQDLGREYHQRYWSVEFSLYRMLVRPATILPGEMCCDDLESFFREHNSIHHVVLVDSRDRPAGLITRHYFSSVLSGPYGYSVFQRRPVEHIVRRDFLVVEEGTDIRTLGKLAMGRSEAEIYDPVVVVDRRGVLVGTISMKQLLSKAFDLEVKFAVSANPLTQLPGNLVIRVWLEEILHKEEYTVIYADLDRFKEYNDRYGFAMGDDMIKLLADILQDQIQFFPCMTRLGHIGGDDFIILVEGRVEDTFLDEICKRFDEKRLALFNFVDRRSGSYAAETRQGEARSVPLVTVSLAVLSHQNFMRPPHPGKLGQSVALLKKEAKKNTMETGKSSFLRERRVYREDDIS
jgi:EAL domain-containing protein (putative c-di-GMP-specific phosphodiesterase class I)/GGDEF domain-containing protein